MTYRKLEIGFGADHRQGNYERKPRPEETFYCGRCNMIPKDNDIETFESEIDGQPSVIRVHKICNTPLTNDVLPAVGYTNQQE